MIGVATRTLLGALASIAVAVFALAATGGTALAAQGICIHASVPEAIRLPEGSEHPGGRIRLCLAGDFSPISSFHKTYVNGTPVGLFLSWRSTIEASLSEPYIVFHRESDGRLRLHSYVLASGGTMQMYRLQQSAGHGTGRSVPTAEGPDLDASAIVLVASRVSSTVRDGFSL